MPWIYVFALLVGSSCCTGQLTVSSGLCRCTASDGGFIDLTNLDSRNAQSPAFSNITTPDQLLSYSYNPCTSFVCGGTNDSAVCVSETNKTNAAVGLQSTAKCAERKPGELALIYSSNDTKVDFEVRLVCSNDNQAQLIASNFNGTLHYLELKSNYCCLSYPLATMQHTTTSATTTTPFLPPPTSSISVGSVLLIIFFSLLLTYLTFGILYRMFVVGARGYEVLPHYEFWSSLPGLIQDGFSFTLQLIFGSSTPGSRAGYSEIDSESPRGTPYQQVPQNPQV